ncbi:MAG: hypothetical protein HC930_07620 [Hydrococcus sp. SU_1_0]|nr:hypothetical protein [Hydrococcus sp. SU_1_0]
MKRDANAPQLTAVFVDYDNIYLSLKRRNEEAARRFAQLAKLQHQSLGSIEKLGAKDPKTLKLRHRQDDPTNLLTGFQSTSQAGGQNTSTPETGPIKKPYKPKDPYEDMKKKETLCSF